MARARNRPDDEVKEVLGAYAGHRLRPLRGGGEEVSYEAIGKSLGLSKPQVYDLINFGGGYGPKVERALADKFFKGSVDALQRAAREWAASNPAPVPPAHGKRVVVEREFRYDALRRVVTNAANKNRWSGAAVAAVREWALDADEDPGEAYWIQALDKADAGLAAVRPRLPRDVVRDEDFDAATIPPPARARRLSKTSPSK